MATIVAATPYDTAKLLFGSKVQTWLNEYDAKRLAAYALYEDIYWNQPDTFKLLMRGTNEHPIYLPNGRIICNTMNRYTAKDFSWGVDPTRGESTAKDLILQAFNSLFKREAFLSKFKTNKRYGIIRGDACFYIRANPEKPDGTRISIDIIDPATVFPIEDENDPTKILGVDIVNQIVKGDTLYVERQRYLRSNHPDHPNYTEDGEGNATNVDGDISYQIDSFEVEGWQDPTTAKKFTEGDNLPPEIIVGITKLPIYKWKNFDEPENPWGSSEIRGLETVLAAVNQAASDQDLALAIAGLGNYVTNAGPPTDDDGNITTWGLGPAEVVEIEGTKQESFFERIGGITSVTPSLEHINMLEDRAYRVSGASDVAQGRVDVQVAESGIALALRMGPILDEASEKDQLILDSMTQMFFDLRQWFDVYEGTDFSDEDPFNPENNTPVIIPSVGPKLPEDKAGRFKQLMEGYTSIPPLFSAAYVRSECRRMGWEMPDDTKMQTDINNEAAAAMAAEEQFSNRLSQEADPNAGDA